MKLKECENLFQMSMSRRRYEGEIYIYITVTFQEKNISDVKCKESLNFFHIFFHVFYTFFL